MVDKIMVTYKIDSSIENSWIAESNRRLELLNKGELETITYKEFFNFALI
ncbi:MAG: hypothetical protein ACI81I_000384 [Arcobacteraceae bacterium]|jgi:hypothetical protein